MNFKKAFLLFTILSFHVSLYSQQRPKYDYQINWAEFLGRSDMLWKDKLPDSWDTGVFVGNGCLGSIFWVNNEGAFNFEISRGDLYDHRRPIKTNTSLYAANRLPNGHFELQLSKNKLNGSMRLDLWNAEARGQINTVEGNLKIRCFTVADRNVIILEVEGSREPNLVWHPDTAKSPRKSPPKEYKAYPLQVQQKYGDIDVSVQDMPESPEYYTDGEGVGQYATAWTKEKKGNKTIYYISMGYSHPGATAEREAINLIKKARKAGIKTLEQNHRKWWHNYYPQSFVSIPDAAMESFYWIQMYKMAAASRQNGPILDLMGPWYMPTGWPAIWWNLNIQLTYWPYYMSNHLNEAEPLLKTVWKAKDALAENAAPYQKDSYAIGRASSPDGKSPVGGEVGNLPWTMHNLWMHYRSSMDDKYLRKQLFPLMKGTFNYLKHIVIKQPGNSKWSLPMTASPEYSDGVENSNYTLACLRWLSSTLIKADARLKTHDPIIGECREMLLKLVPYETDETTGLMVGKDLPFAKSHRHWSHLFMIYPFNEFTWDNPNQVPLIQKSLQHWLSMPQAFAGYSWLGAASILEEGGHGDEALKYLHTFLKKSPQPNTLYREGFPVIETPLAFARTMQEMLLTSHNDLIRVFPGIPTSWKDVSFANFRAEGAFLISAFRKNGITQYIKIESLAGEPCKVKTGLSGEIKAKGIDTSALKDLGKGMVVLKLKKGETAILYTTANSPSLRFNPVIKHDDSEAINWGERKPL